MVRGRHVARPNSEARESVFAKETAAKSRAAVVSLLRKELAMLTAILLGLALIAGVLIGVFGIAFAILAALDTITRPGRRKK
ncbi:MAG TPA: hypothetical protein VGM17_02320 [Rhizomicrobium sp.]